MTCCWKDYQEWATETYGAGSKEAVGAFLDGGATCMLHDGHDGPHAWTPDTSITVAFKAEVTDAAANPPQEK